VHVLPLVDIKVLLIGLVGNAVPDLLSYHHLVALYGVVHYIFQLWLVSLQINHIKEDEFIGGHLNTVCVLGVVDSTSNLNGFEHLPFVFFS
jgi:hypothetical protein